MTALRVVFAGTPVFAVPPLAALLGRHEVVGVLTQPDRPAGRGRELRASPVKEAALAAGLAVLQPRSLRNDPAAIDALRAWQPDIMVVVAYGLILPPAVLELPRLGCLNIHASLLPRWRGAAPIQRAILAGDAESGVTIMQMDAGLDTGAMLLREAVPIGAQTTAGELHDALAALGARLIVEALADCAAGRTRPEPQPAEGVSYAAKLAKSEAQIDWMQPAAHIDRQIRAFNPWPVAETHAGGEVLKLLRSRLPREPRPAAGMPPGTVLGLEGDALEIACGDGERLQVLTLQRPGRRAVGARDYFNASTAGGGAAPVWG
ncbi:MAG: methionyl-tRNA formyltransferase [Steroidobacteraceae bacterium]